MLFFCALAKLLSARQGLADNKIRGVCFAEHLLRDIVCALALADLGYCKSFVFLSFRTGSWVVLGKPHLPFK